MYIHGGKKISVTKSNFEVLLSKLIQTRENYLDKDDVNKVYNRIVKKNNLIFLPNDISESAMFENYKLIMYGILQCGSKATVIINNIYPFVDIEYNNNKNDKENIEELKKLLKHSYYQKLLKNRQVDLKSIKIVHGKKFMLFTEEPIKFIRISFNKGYHRTQFIKLLKKLEIESYNNDISNYYRVVARTYKINLCNWNLLTNYSINTKLKDTYKSKYIFNIDINDIKAFDGDYVKYNNIENLSLPIDTYQRDKMISMSFDIEQYSSNFNPERPDIVILPSGKIKEDEIFNIGLTYQFINESDSFLNIALLTKEAEPHPDYLTIICQNEITLLLVFAYLNELMQPDFIMEFNGSEFDWINIYDKCLYYKIIQKFCSYMSIKKLNNYELKEENISKYLYNQDSVKISADIPQKAVRNFNLDGYIPFDVRVLFMQLNPTESKSSLSFYLTLNNLPNKDDMPIPELFEIYRTSNIKKMTDVAHYCYIDCFRLHQLIHKNNVIQDRREISTLAYTSMFDAFYRANGCKVRNLIISEAIDKDLFVNNIKTEEKEEDKKTGKFPGALVLNPKKGLINNLLNIQEFCNEKLNIYDDKLIEELQEIINKNYEDIYINKNIDNIKY
jgi:hypothetical protein